MKNLGLLAIALLTATTLHAQQRALYRDPAAPIEQRVEDLLARMTQDETAAEGASLLKSIFGGSDTLAILTTWIGDSEKDGDLDAKGALGELRAAALARLGVTLPSDGTNSRMRSITARYVLANEFRLDLDDQGSGGPGPRRAEQSPLRRPAAVVPRGRF